MADDRYVLIADDDPLVSDVVRRYLERDGLPTSIVADGAAAAEHLAAGRVRLAVLDVMMPGLDGIELCRRVRGGAVGARRDLPLILLTALGEEDHRVTGLAAGADDYVTKPFSPRELALRVASVLRRAPHEHAAALGDGAVVLDAAARTVTASGRAVGTTRREFDLLAHFLAHPGEAFTREDLLEQVWGWQFGDLSTVTVHVKRLRAKLGDDHRIETVWGRGYRWGSGEEGTDD
ncbi:DNA-binding response regulator [Tsukamurella pulmonis]|uniref:DNA-binding response regulator, OmpR family, contains REC and winged-helix (WHTH) domain n=1 Tax=Tsukamurella pulmonis TaxID=47312 RepID=A0A1H1C1G6_9ACTN|nr:response regulator transcription factor [Tsukamurella pulmonis]KXO90109.1 two-component system response regulator [Tsukamurella pulmonis]KXP11361.1 two-component system response regulator [Tsukamurella pulmonis]RDH10591.1 DNA-binding response regulator [Tsukamurella pulmonis]SDQ57981.1 DNA-binding response regulator, OmpR family, contains REC and winged-helix (wHTH) domain [Tsukamurella pulmonis]SUP24376.1 Staphylococcal respiratory response protein A [Tsukamurella pulmonis]